MRHDTSGSICATGSLSDFTGEMLILPQAGAGDLMGVIDELSRLLHAHGGGPDPREFSQAVRQRESLASTATDYGIAFPHARMPELKRLAFALGRSPHPIACSPPALRPIHFVVLSAVPESDPGGYLMLISAWARLSKDALCLDRLQAARDAREIYALLQQVPIRRG